MSETTATRTLVKSPPELWAECSEASSLGRHLPAFGEITITKLDPETTVAWEGERVSGTVRIEPSGWGTRVTLTARPEGLEAGSEPQPEPVVEPVAAEPEPVAVEPEPVAVEPEPVAVEPAPEPEPAPIPLAPPPPRKAGLMARLRGLFRPPEPEQVAVLPEPEPQPVAAEPEPEAVTPEPAPELHPEPAPQAPSPAAELAELEATLAAALDSLGQAHHRPFSRA